MGLGSFIQIRWCYANFHRNSGVNTLFAIQEKQERQVRFLAGKEPLEEGIATYSNILAGKIPWTEEPSVLWSMESQKDVHD